MSISTAAKAIDCGRPDLDSHQELTEKSLSDEWRESNGYVLTHVVIESETESTITNLHTLDLENREIDYEYALGLSQRSSTLGFGQDGLLAFDGRDKSRLQAGEVDLTEHFFRDNQGRAMRSVRESCKDPFSRYACLKNYYGYRNDNLALKTEYACFHDSIELRQTKYVYDENGAIARSFEYQRKQEKYPCVATGSSPIEIFCGETDELEGWIEKQNNQPLDLSGQIKDCEVNFSNERLAALRCMDWQLQNDNPVLAGIDLESIECEFHTRHRFPFGTTLEGGRCGDLSKTKAVAFDTKVQKFECKFLYDNNKMNVLICGQPLEQAETELVRACEYEIANGRLAGTSCGRLKSDNSIRKTTWQSFSYDDSGNLVKIVDSSQQYPTLPVEKTVHQLFYEPADEATLHNIPMFKLLYNRERVRSTF